MPTSKPHHPLGHGRCESLAARLVLFSAAALLALAVLPSTGLAAYGWPVEPFDHAHPIRGSFGDPRTLFFDAPTRAGLYHSAGSFSFHQGVDVAAPDGTSVYPVESGVVTVVTHDGIRVGSADVSFEYWHVRPSVRVGDQVTARRTVLGTILGGAGHVHLTEIDRGVVTDPLLPGHLTPYRDTTVPYVASIHIRGTDEGPDVMPGLVRGRVQLIAEAYDTPTLPVAGSGTASRCRRRS